MRSIQADLTYELSTEQYNLLYKAMERYLRFVAVAPPPKTGKPIPYINSLVGSRTGYGTRVQYTPALEAGLMYALSQHKDSYRNPEHWSLTERGAAIVQWWLDCGYGACCQEQDNDESIWTTVRLSRKPPRVAEVPQQAMQELRTLMPAGEPAHLRCFDNENNYKRYTAILTSRQDVKGFIHLKMNRNPFVSRGVAVKYTTEISTFTDLGSTIAFVNLPNEVKQYIRMVYVKLWNLQAPWKRGEKNEL